MPENALGEKKRNERRESMSLKSRALKSAIALKFGKYARRFKIKLFEIFFFESANLFENPNIFDWTVLSFEIMHHTTRFDVVLQTFRPDNTNRLISNSEH